MTTPIVSLALEGRSADRQQRGIVKRGTVVAVRSSQPAGPVDNGFGAWLEIGPKNMDGRVTRIDLQPSVPALIAALDNQINVPWPTLGGRDAGLTDIFIRAYNGLRITNPATGALAGRVVGDSDGVRAILSGTDTGFEPGRPLVVERPRAIAELVGPPPSLTAMPHVLLYVNAIINHPGSAGYAGGDLTFVGGGIVEGGREAAGTYRVDGNGQIIGTTISDGGDGYTYPPQVYPQNQVRPLTSYVVDVEIYTPAADPILLTDVESTIPLRPGQGVWVNIPSGDVLQGVYVSGRLTPSVQEVVTMRVRTNIQADDRTRGTGIYPVIGFPRVWEVTAVTAPLPMAPYSVIVRATPIGADYLTYLTYPPSVTLRGDLRIYIQDLEVGRLPWVFVGHLGILFDEPVYLGDIVVNGTVTVPEGAILDHIVAVDELDRAFPVAWLAMDFEMVPGELSANRHWQFADSDTIRDNTLFRNYSDWTLATYEHRTMQLSANAQGLTIVLDITMRETGPGSL